MFWRTSFLFFSVWPMLSTFLMLLRKLILIFPFFGGEIPAPPPPLTPTFSQPILSPPSLITHHGQAHDGGHLCYIDKRLVAVARVWWESLLQRGCCCCKTSDSHHNCYLPLLVSFTSPASLWNKPSHVGPFQHISSSPRRKRWERKSWEERGEEIEKKWRGTGRPGGSASTGQVERGREMARQFFGRLSSRWQTWLLANYLPLKFCKKSLFWKLSDIRETFGANLSSEQDLETKLY